jgi:hypothetical protein
MAAAHRLQITVQTFTIELLSVHRHNMRYGLTHLSQHIEHQLFIVATYRAGLSETHVSVAK